MDVNLLNRSGIWTSLADALVTEMCLKDAGNESDNLRSVPKLEEDAHNFYPLQVRHLMGICGPGDVTNFDSLLNAGKESMRW